MPNPTRKEPEAKLAAPAELTAAELDAVAAAGGKIGIATGDSSINNTRVKPFGGKGGVSGSMG